jgi:two-component system sensor histidine kinase AlgZ
MTTSSRCYKDQACLPDFRNLGIILRFVFATSSLHLLFCYAATGDVADALRRFSGQLYYFEPVFLAILLVFFAAAGRLGALSYPVGLAASVLVVGVVSTAWYGVVGRVPELVAGIGYAYAVVMTLVVVLATLFYFDWRRRVLSPALVEARLMALQARIRPHFLFNSLNTVLGLIRAEPKRAEAVLENLAELYRALLSEAGTLVPLGREIDLARAYAEIETLRLGPRLTLNWQYQGAPLDALVPPLILQPLLENAVYHGVEPSESGGAVSVTIFSKGEQVNLVVRNPCDSPAQRRSGNRMALDNIRERLALHFDAEAEMSAYEAGGEFVVQIRIPYKHD